MKRLFTAMAALIITASTISAQRIADFSAEARYITDKMAVELGLTKSQCNSILQINLNYLGGITTSRDISSNIWKQRNKRVKAMLTEAQWRRFKDAYYFYRPIGWKNGAYVHNIYAKYPKAPIRSRFDRPRGGRPDAPRFDRHDGPKFDKRKGPYFNDCKGPEPCRGPEKCNKGKHKDRRR